MPQHVRARTALVLLVALLLAGRSFVAALPHSPAHGPALVFFSANTEEGLSLAQAVQRLDAPDQQRHRVLAARLLRRLSVGPALVHDAIGDWQGEVENSFLVVLPRIPDLHSLRLAAACFGLISDQKAVLAFHPRREGGDLLVTLGVPGSVGEVRRKLTEQGIKDRTILIEANECRVIVLVEQQRMGEMLAVAEKLNATIDARRGSGEWIAAPTRDEARQRYREVLGKSRLAATFD